MPLSTLNRPCPTFPVKVITLLGEELYLLPERAIYWPAQQALLLADLHLGKSGHFRKHGIAVSPDVLQKDLDRLASLLQRWKPEQVFFLGDLFHSRYNQEWEPFAELLKGFKGKATLVKRNHDILKSEQYVAAGLELVGDHLDLGPFRLIHEHPAEPEQGTPYCIAGHVHPGVWLQGGGRQRLKLPCYFFGEQHGLLPAFGNFTGLYCLEPTEKDQVYVLVEDQVVQVG